MSERVFTYPFGDIHALYVTKVERKGKTRAELDDLIGWLTGYDEAGLQDAVDDGRTLREFFAQAPAMNPNTDKITGLICGMRVEQIEDPLMQQIRWMDKLVDELARGKKIASIKRS